MADPYAQLALDAQLCFPLYAATRAVTQRYAVLLGEEGLTYPQYLSMLALWESAPVGVTELGDRLRLDSGTLSPVLKRLEAAGLVARHRDDVDERRVRVEVTAEGWALRDRLADLPTRLSKGMHLPAADVVRLKALLHDLLAGLDGSTPG